MIYSHTIPSAHLVPANTSPGSGISSPRYTCVPRHRIRPPSCRGMFVSMETALVPITGLLAPPWHWIFPHLASLFKSHRQNTMSEHATTVLNVFTLNKWDKVIKRLKNREEIVLSWVNLAFHTLSLICEEQRV